MGYHIDPQSVNKEKPPKAVANSRNQKIAKERLLTRLLITQAERLHTGG
jgi:hypothetical protein